jgi:hypothetical protein
VEAGTEVRPHHEEQHDLLERRPFARPQQPDDALVVDVVAEQHPGAARAHDMHDEERRDREAQAELQRFPDRHAQRRTPVETDQCQNEMRQQGAIEQDRPRRAAPPRGEHDAHAVHRLDRDHAERVVQEVPDDEAGDHQPRHQAQ